MSEELKANLTQLIESWRKRAKQCEVKATTHYSELGEADLMGHAAALEQCADELDDIIWSLK